MSPGNRPSHFGAKPLHITRPTSVAITPMITMTFPNSRTFRKLRESIGGTSLRPDAGTVSRLLRDARGAKNRERGRDSQRFSKAGAQVSPGRGEGQEGRRRKIQGDQRSIRSSERSGKAEEIRSAWRGLEPAGRFPAATAVARTANARRRVLPMGRRWRRRG